MRMDCRRLRFKWWKSWLRAEKREGKIGGRNRPKIFQMGIPVACILMSMTPDSCEIRRRSTSKAVLGSASGICTLCTLALHPSSVGTDHVHCSRQTGAPATGLVMICH